MVETFKNSSERALHILKTEFDKKMQDIKSQCKDDITKIDGLRKEATSKLDNYK